MHAKDRLTSELRPGLPRGLWYASGLSLRTVSAGGRRNEQEAAIIYDGPDGALAVATLFRTEDWVDRDDLAAFELWLDREGVPLRIQSPFDDTLRVGSAVVLRTRFVIGADLGADALRDSDVEPTELLAQLQRRQSSF
jgi:hypothetical protein